MFHRVFQVFHTMRATPVPAVYLALVLEVERRRVAVGVPMERMSELMGTAERSYSKMIHADTPSGRVAQWSTLQSAIDVLFHDGFRLQLEPDESGAITSAGVRRRIRAERARWDASTTRQHMTELSALACAARKQRTTERQRAHLQGAGRARWANVPPEERKAAMAAIRSARRCQNP